MSAPQLGAHASQDCRDGLHGSGCVGCSCSCHVPQPSHTQPDYTTPRGRLVDRLQDAGAGMGFGDAEAIVSMIENLISVALDEHRENAPHIYPDGSTS